MIVDDPSDLQWEAIKAVGDFLQDDSQQVFRLFGAAGTGKTTILKFLLHQYCPTAYVCALSGKAVDVLRDKGIDRAQTFHSFIYKPILPDADEIERLVKQLDATKKPNEKARIRSELMRAREIRWALNKFASEEREERTIVILDEASMIGENLTQDLLEVADKVIAVGDPFQLPPVKDKPFLTQSAPDVLLTEIHRQAAESPILRLATSIREGARPVAMQEPGCLVSSAPGMLSPEIISAFDKVICGKHVTRRELNKQVRKHRGFEDVVPQKGENLICIKNIDVPSKDEAIQVFNGQEITVVESHDRDFGLLDMTLDKRGTSFRAEVYEGPFLEHYDPDEIRDSRHYSVMNKSFNADFGYAVTCHKAQGSEYENVFIYDDGFGQSPRERMQWLYTAVTRARTGLAMYSFLV